jgi:hypothetical protein
MVAYDAESLPEGLWSGGVFEDEQVRIADVESSYCGVCLERKRWTGGDLREVKLACTWVQIDSGCPVMFEVLGRDPTVPHTRVRTLLRPSTSVTIGAIGEQGHSFRVLSVSLLTLGLSRGPKVAISGPAGWNNRRSVAGKLHPVCRVRNEKSEDFDVSGRLQQVLFHRCRTARFLIEGYTSRINHMVILVLLRISLAGEIQPHGNEPMRGLGPGSVPEHAHQWQR